MIVAGVMSGTSADGITCSGAATYIAGPGEDARLHFLAHASSLIQTGSPRSIGGNEFDAGQRG